MFRRPFRVEETLTLMGCSPLALGYCSSFIASLDCAKVSS